MKAKVKLFNFNIFLEHYERLKRISDQTRIPISQIINTLIKEYLEKEKTKGDKT